MKTGKISPFRIIALILLLNILLLPLNSFSEDETDYTSEYTPVMINGFESKEYKGWSSFGNQSKIGITDKKAHSGKYSIAVTEREASWSGPVLNLTELVEQDSTIIIRAYALSGSENVIDVMLSLKYTDINGNEKFETIAMKETGGDEWTLLENTVMIPSDIADVCVYFETSSGVVDDFYIDDIEILGQPKSDDPNDTDDSTNLKFNFSNGLSGWIPRGDLKIEISEDRGYPNKPSLYVTDKTAFWNAPMVRLNSLKPGVNYTFSACVMYMNSKEKTHDFSINLQYNFKGGEVYSTISKNTVLDGSWTTISGDYVIPEGATDIYFYIQGDEDDGTTEFLSFYVDNVTIIDSTEELKVKKIKIAVISIVSTIAAIGLIMLIVMLVKKSKVTKAAIRASFIDNMTNTYNRNTFEEQVKEFEKNPEKCRDIYVTVCDVNFLKYINDNYGHDSGDKAIIRCASVLLKAIGKRGKVYRTGGDEFICLSEADFTEAIKIEFARENIDYKGYPFSVAVGTAHYDPLDDVGDPDIKALIAKSDKEMYKHKLEVKKDFDFA